MSVEEQQAGVRNEGEEVSQSPACLSAVDLHPQTVRALTVHRPCVLGHMVQHPDAPKSRTQKDCPLDECHMKQGPYLSPVLCLQA